MSVIKLSYLAGPFRHDDPTIQRKRCAALHFAAAQLFLQGQHVFSPLTHNELLIDIIKDAIPKEHWMQFDLAILSMCKRLYVLKMPGWELSQGVQREIGIAKEKGMEIVEIDPPNEEEYLHLVRSI